MVAIVNQIATPCPPRGVEVKYQHEQQRFRCASLDHSMFGTDGTLPRRLADKGLARYEAKLDPADDKRIFRNAGSGNRTELKVRLRRLLGGYNPAHVEFEKFAPHLTEAVDRARKLDPDLTRCPRTLGTHVYRIIEPLLEGVVDCHHMRSGR